MHNRLPLLTATLTASMITTCLMSHGASAQMSNAQQWPVLQTNSQQQRPQMQQQQLQQHVQKQLMQQQRAAMPQAATTQAVNTVPQHAIQRHTPEQHQSNQQMHQPQAQQQQMQQQFMNPANDPRNPSYGIQSQGGGAIPALPLHIMVSPANVYFVNGGIGDEEMQQLAMVEKEFNLHVQLSDGQGAYISDVTLRLLNESGQELLSVNDAGPYLYAKLPAGKYVLETYDAARNVRKNNTVKVNETGITKKYVIHK